MKGELFRRAGWAVLLYAVIRLALAPVAATIAMPGQQKNMQPTASAAGRSLLSPWDRWDVEFYRAIAADGYGADPRTTNFHPFYAWIGRIFGWLTGGNWLLGLLIASGLATIGLYVLLARLAPTYGAEGSARWAAVVFTLLPAGFILYAPYSESLFLVCAAGCFLFLHQRRWCLAGLMGLLASLTRQQGIVLVAPMLWEISQAAGGVRQLIRRWRWVLAAGLPLLGFALVVLYRSAALGGLPERWWLPQNWIYSVMISPQAQNVVPGQRFTAPWTALWLALGQLGTPPALPRWIDLITGAIYLLLLAVFWRQLRPSARAYCAIIYLLAFSYHTGELFGYMGLSRHLLLAFPLAFPLARWSDSGPRRLLVGLIGGGLLLGQTVMYVAHGWVP